MRTEFEKGFVDISVGRGPGRIRVHESLLVALGFNPQFSAGLTVDRLLNRAFERNFSIKIGAVTDTVDGEAGTCTIRFNQERVAHAY